jgi:hypothetical protein
VAIKGGRASRIPLVRDRSPNREFNRYPKGIFWLTYTQLSRKYGMSYFASRVHWHLTDGMAGDIISFRAFGQVVVVLNSIEVNKDLLEKRPDIYSDRPLIPIFDMYVFLKRRIHAWCLMKFRMGWYWNLGLGNCTEEWRLGSKLLNRSLRPASVATYRPMLEAKYVY